jgi:hypothetical protein
MTYDNGRVDNDLGITLAGGGNRAFYELGLLNRWGPSLRARIRGIAACSAGACVIVMYLSGRADPAHAFWLGRREGITRNFDWGRLLEGRRPAPQYDIYRDTILHTLEEGGFDRVRGQPFPVLILAARFPRLLPRSVAAAVGISAYSLEKSLRRRMIHPSLGRALGFSPESVDARDCESPEELAALILASSATPPFTPVGLMRGRPLLDGGMVDNVPAFLAESIPGVRRNLVLLSRPYPAEVLGRQGNRLYVAPTRAVPAGRWDYTRPDSLARTIRMGEDEATLHAPLLEEFLA